LENVFYNRAGHSKCYNVNESPTYGGICPSGQYATDGNFVFKEGNSVKSSSFFSVIQNSMQDVVKIVLTLSIVFYGMNILTGKADIRQKKDILMYLVKIGLVLYFATGDAWQNQFFKGVYGASSQLSQIVFKISTPDAENQRDGCQFGKLAKSDGTEIASVQNYPVGKEYLALWDTLDCKMMRYLGFGPEVSVANIVSLIFAAFFTGAAGIYFALSVMIFGFFFIQAAIRALHIFLSSCISIIIMVFVSPIIIPTALFHKTSNIFKQWTVELMSFCLQPLILFAYIAFFITIMDKTMIGSATFSGNPPAKRVSCEIICKKSDGTIVPYSNGAPPACDNPGEKKINPLNDSVACLININDFGKFPGFELIGISIPVIKNVFEGNVKEKILTILKGALVMFLLAQFMDEIPGITSALMGGVGLPGSTVKASDLFNKTAGAVAAAQARIAGGLKKHGGSGAKSAYEAVKSHTGKEGSKGKSVDRAPGGGGSRGEVDDE
jgi:type IV secretory pathway VirB6-like protein